MNSIYSKKHVKCPVYFMWTIDHYKKFEVSYFRKNIGFTLSILSNLAQNNLSVNKNRKISFQWKINSVNLKGSKKSFFLTNISPDLIKIRLFWLKYNNLKSGKIHSGQKLGGENTPQKIITIRGVLHVFSAQAWGESMKILLKIYFSM